MPTINQHCAPGHERAGVAESKERRAAELLRRRQPPKHVLGLPDPLRTRLPLKHFLHHRRDNVTGTERVHPDPVPPPLHGQVPGQLQNSRLAGVVDRASHPLVGDKTRHASHEQDGALLLVVEHLAGGGGGAVEDTVVVDVHDLVELLLGVRECWLEVVDACGGNEAVQPAVLLGDFGEDTVCFGGVAHVDPVVVQAAPVVGFSVLPGDFVV